jgi:PTS system N-acetylglucosamine-specific IIC component
VKLGFTFSAGALDYVLNFTKSTRPLLLVPVGAAYFVIYYAAFSFAIRRFDLKTPGREEDAGEVVVKAGERGQAFVAALGGSTNLSSIDACTTRLRLVVVDQAKVDEAQLKSLGARGLLRPSAQGLQVVLGPIADQVATEMRDAAGTLAAPALATEQAATQSARTVDAKPWLAAIGGRDNVVEAGAASSRLWLRLHDPARIDAHALEKLGTKAVAMPGKDIIHLIVGAEAEPIAVSLLQ